MGYILYKFPIVLKKKLLKDNKIFASKKLLELFILNSIINANRCHFFYLYNNSMSHFFTPLFDLYPLESTHRNLNSILFIVSVDSFILKDKNRVLYLIDRIEDIIKKIFLKKNTYLHLMFDRMYQDSYNDHKFKASIKHKSCITEHDFFRPYIKNSFLEKYDVVVSKETCLNNCYLKLRVLPLPIYK